MTLFEKVKSNLILEHDEDDELLKVYIKAAISYAESFQHLSECHYQTTEMSPSTEIAVIMLASHFYESRDGSTGGFYSDNVSAAQRVWDTVNSLLRLDKNWSVGL